MKENTEKPFNPHEGSADMGGFFGGDSSLNLADLLSEIEELRLYKSEHERLKETLNKILHPNGDGPKAPNFADLISYVRGDLKG